MFAGFLREIFVPPIRTGSKQLLINKWIWIYINGHQHLAHRTQVIQYHIIFCYFLTRIIPIWIPCARGYFPASMCTSKLVISERLSSFSGNSSK
jgi:hypothetical protein